MRVVLISSTYGLNNTGGAAIAATRLHLALLAAGVESHFITLSACEEGPNVHVLKFRSLLKRKILKLAYNVIVNIKGIIIGRSCKLKKVDLPAHLVRIVDLETVLSKINPDVVHIHWINGEGFSWGQIARLKYPVVFHLHDMHLFTTSFGYAWDDARYHLGYDRNDSTFEERLLVKIKRKMLVSLKPLVLGPSAWICKEFSRSVIGRGCETAVVPNVMDSRICLRREPKSSGRSCVLLFGCSLGTKNPYKGWDDLVRALNFVSDEVKGNLLIRVFGEDADTRYQSGVRVEYLGNLNSVDELCDAYNSSDVVVMPSRQDNAPSVKFEGWLCGLPVLTFARQGCAEGVKNKINGWVSPDNDFADYAKGIEYFYRLFASGELEKMHVSIARIAAKACATNEIIAQMKRIYQCQIERRVSARKK